MQPLSPIATTLYSQLQELALADEISAAFPGGSGHALCRTVKGRRYWYWSARSGGTPRSLYLGPDDEATRTQIAALESARENAREAAAALESSTRAFLSAGGMAAEPAHARVLERLAEGGLLRKGLVMIGSHAFVAIGNMLGVRWGASTAGTLDIDLVRAESVALVVPPQPEPMIDVPEVLRKFDDAYFLVPELDPRQPSTSIANRRTRVKIDFLTTLRGTRTAPVFFADLNIAATPLRFMDYLVGGTPIRGLLMCRRALPCLLPEPARFALHKLVVSRERPVTAANKARKDIAQAAELILALEEARPGDVKAAQAALKGVPGTSRRLAAAIKALRVLSPEAAEALA